METAPADTEPPLPDALTQIDRFGQFLLVRLDLLKSGARAAMYPTYLVTSASSNHQRPYELCRPGDQLLLGLCSGYSGEKCAGGRVLRRVSSIILSCC